MNEIFAMLIVAVLGEKVYKDQSPGEKKKKIQEEEYQESIDTLIETDKLETEAI